MSRPLGLYIHVPFCKQKCVYCDFYSLPHREEQMDAYAAALRAQLFETDFSGCEADTVYFGGGTPSYLGPRRLTALLEAVSAACPIASGAEITFEANPDSAGDAGDLSALRRAGFNRISLGMQSADDGELRAIGRVHTMAQVCSAVEAARKAGFDNLSLDLIYGLPGQDLSRWRKNLAAAVALNPEHLSCYGLKAEPGTPLYARRDALPGDEAQAEMYLETVEYAGFGPGAHSDFHGRRFAWARDLEAFLREEALLSESQAVTSQERAAEWLMLSLRLTRGLDPDIWETRFGRPFAPFLPFLERCAAAGYALRDGPRWRLTPQGFLVSNQIIGELLDNLQKE